MSNRFSTSERRGTIVVVILMAISVFIIVMNRVADAKVPEAVVTEVSGNEAMHPDGATEQKAASKRQTATSRQPRKTRTDRSGSNGHDRPARNPLSEPVD